MIDEVIKFTLLNIYEVYRMAAMEFFMYVQYIATREKNRADEIKRIQRS